MVYWSEEGDDLIPLFEPPTTAPGLPEPRRARDRYAERSGRDLSEIDFFVALGYWKLAIILEGVFARYAAGQYGKEGADEAQGVREDRPAPGRGSRRGRARGLALEAPRGALARGAGAGARSASSSRAQWLSSRRAITFLCTSSAPSATRSMRL